MPDGVILILVRDILGAGLFAALAEEQGLHPVFQQPGERPETAVERARPSRILLECDHPAARSEQFFAAAASLGSRVILFAASAPWADWEAIAKTHNVAAFVRPAPGESLSARVAAALAE